MLSMLIDDGALRRENGSWVPAGDLGDVTIPPTIQSLLAARLDRLHGEERAVIERASVEGKVFHRGAVVELSPEPARAGVGGHLMTLVRKELIRPDRSDVPGDDAFRFRHILIRDAAYEAMPKQTRAELHEEFAGWLERRAGESPEYEEILGYHLEQAYRYRLELGPVGEREHELAHRAAQPLASAGRRAVKRGDVRAAVTLLSRARDLLPDDDPARIALLPDLGTAFGESGDLPRAEAVLTEAVTRARESGDRGTEMRAALERARLRSYTDPASWGEAIDTAERAAGVFEELKDERGLATAWQLIAGIRFNRGELSAHGAAIERALPHAERSGAESTLAALVAHRCSGALHGPVPVEEAIQIHEEALERVRALRSRHIEGALLLSLGRLRGMGGDYDEARALIAQGRSILDEMGLELMAAMAPAEHLGFVAGLFRDFETAEDAFRNGYEMLERMGEKGYLSTIAAALAQTLTERGSYDEAERFSEISEEAAAADDVWSQILWRCARARTRAQRGDLDQAEVLAREGLGLAMETEIVLLQGEAFETLAHVLRLRADADAAAEALRQAVDLYERKGIVPAADTARAELAELAGDRAPAG
jgi:predicted ATPase